MNWFVSNEGGVFSIVDHDHILPMSDLLVRPTEDWMDVYFGMTEIDDVVKETIAKYDDVMITWEGSPFLGENVHVSEVVDWKSDVIHIYEQFNGPSELKVVNRICTVSRPDTGVYGCVFTVHFTYQDSYFYGVIVKGRRFRTGKAKSAMFDYFVS